MSKQIEKKLDHIEQLLVEQSILQKEVLNFNETCQYLGFSESHLYKLTSTGNIPCFKPQGKRIYFNRRELDDWLQRNRIKTADQIEIEAATYVVSNKK